MRVAIIEDDRSVRKALHRLLACSNLVADTFTSVRQFLTSLKRNQPKPDCVLLDLKMPGLDELELLRVLAERRLSLPVVVISAFDTPKARNDCASLGAAAFLPKPFDEEELLATISAAIEARSSRTKGEAVRPANTGPMDAV